MRLRTCSQKHAKALQQLGWLYYKDEDNVQAATEYLKRATDADPQDALGWYLLGRGYMATQSHELAYGAYEQVHTTSKYMSKYTYIVYFEVLHRHTYFEVLLYCFDKHTEVAVVSRPHELYMTTL